MDVDEPVEAAAALVGREVEVDPDALVAQQRPGALGIQQGGFGPEQGGHRLDALGLDHGVPQQYLSAVRQVP